MRKNLRGNLEATAVCNQCGEEFQIIACVGDHSDLREGDHSHESLEETCGTDAACEDGDHSRWPLATRLGVVIADPL